jgi:hypothetical protein
VQVDADELRAAAAELRDEVADRLRHTARIMGEAEREFAVEAAFDDYTTAAPYRAFANGWTREFELVTEAARELADALDEAAAAYDRSDAAARTRIGAAARRIQVPR